MIARRIWQLSPGKYRFDLSNDERDVLRSLPEDFRILFDKNDDSLVRLFPPAYLDDPERDNEYQELMRSELMARHLEALRLMEDTVDAQTMNDEQLSAWMRALNEIRLVLGTQMNVSEEFDETLLREDDPDSPMLAMYGYLGELQHEIVEALAGALPDTGPD